ncbi:protein phosphatase 2C domain-containing protein [Verrucomicrobium spinosum]|uniref:protein phosphatase 2C domain-containing protein n=1 Tax=Verrucomicrobium spinosum TaxID=2736 RepID=UPI0001745BAE|nr:protein phosphatase 2C domain-containing protein [Verrucomicrobium spinosum]
MAAINSLGTRNEQRQPLHKFLLGNRHLIQADPARIVLPLLQCLAEIHAEGKSHGAVCAQRLMCAPNGDFDVAFFRHRIGWDEGLTAAETYYGYPSGQGETMEEQQQRDKQALANVLHLLMLGHEAPPPPARLTASIVSRLGEDTPWPQGFVSLVEHLLTMEGHEPTPELDALIHALAPTAPLPPAEAVAISSLPEIPPSPANEELVPAPAEIMVPEVAASDTEAPPPPLCIEKKFEASPAAPSQAAPTPVSPDVNFREPPTPSPLPSYPVRLPNATVGRDYTANVLTHLATGALTFASFEPAAALPDGLATDGITITGSPLLAGEYEIPVACLIQGADPDRPDKLLRTLQITINADPRSLWKNQESDPTSPFWKPDAESAALTDTPRLVAAASLRGRSHAHVGSCRDDDFSLAWFPASGWYALTVADGAGSAKYSRQGSKIACAKVKEHFASLLGENGQDTLTPLTEAWAADAEAVDKRNAVRSELYNQFGRAAYSARKAIEDQANEAQATLRDFHTTLIITLARPMPTGSWFIAAFSVGDGGAAVIGVPDGATCLLTQPDGGEFAGQTIFLTMKEVLATGEGIMNRIKFALVPQFDALVLVTDGISDPKFNSEVALADPAAWQELWTELRPLVAGAGSRDGAAASLLQWMNFFSPGHHDDRTIAVLCETHLPSPS